MPAPVQSGPALDQSSVPTPPPPPSPTQSGSVPTWVPSASSDTPIAASAPETPPVQQTSEPTPQVESAPTDLSHLISNNAQSETQVPPVPSDTLVVPPVSNPAIDSPTLPVEHKGIPKWLIGVGAGLLIIVIGASAYFILGVGQPTENTSLPATETTPVLTTPPVSTSAPQSTQSTGISNFGALEDSTSATPEASSTGTIP